MFRTKAEAWEIFRIGPKGSYNNEPQKRTHYPGVKFPIKAFDQFCKQIVPRWTTTDRAIQVAYNTYIKTVGDAVIMAHSQGCNFAFNAALAAPDKVKAVIALEPSGAPSPGPALAKLRDIPILIVWGDYMGRKDLALPWPKFVAGVKAFADGVKSKGGKLTWLNLPELGILGNDHMFMMDTNSDKVAAIIQDWMTKNNLMK